VGVITNGTAVLGLGDIGPLAAKPVMEGKGCLFKKFAGVDVFDIELAERDPDKLIDIIASMEPTLGGINLEDIKAPECFYIEQELSKRMNIPVFHDDQHGTAIISSAALLNGLELVGKDIGKVKVAVSGAGAAAIACVNVMVGLGVKRENVFMVDSKGVIYEGRPGGLDASKARTHRRPKPAPWPTWSTAPTCSWAARPRRADGRHGQDHGRQAHHPGLANPEPEIRPELAKAVRPDCIMATGRSDYPNQVNNVLCFPYIFRGALDCGATKITEAMKLACVREIAALAKQDVSDEVAAAYQGKELTFGPDYLIPTPFDAPDPAHRPGRGPGRRRIRCGHPPHRGHRGLPRKPDPLRLPDQHVHAPGVCRRQGKVQRVAYAEGEDERVLRAVQVAVDDGLAKPILIGRPAVIEARIAKAGLRIQPGKDVEICNPEDDPRFRQYWETYHQLMGRDGVTPKVPRPPCAAPTP
jgi:malate dehydrogenase (oxaloacetate-decarboxylating)(NADP+)